MRFLRTNTAIRLTVGPFFDKGDGVTPETAITVTNEKLTFVVDDANVPTLVLDTAPTASGGNNDMVHITGDDAGFYDLELTAANTNYLGRAMLSLTDASVHCPVFHEFMIIPAMIYDSLILGSDRLDTNVTHIADTAQTARDIGASVLLSSGTGTGQLDFTSGVVKSNVTQYGGSNGTFASGRPEVNTSHVGGSAVDQASGILNVNVKQISTDATAADNAEAFFDGTGYAGTGNTIPTVTTVNGLANNVITAASLAADAGAEIADAVWDEAQSGHTTAGTFGKYLDDEITDVLHPTVSGRTLDVTTTGEAGIDWANIGGPTTTVNLSGTTVKTATDVETDTQDIQGRLPAALVSGRIDASVGAMAANVLTASAIASDAITAAKIATNAIDADALAADAVTEIQSGLSTSSAVANVQTDVDDIQSRLPAALSGDGFIKADLKSIDDELTNGNNATLHLKQLHISNSAGVGAVIASDTAAGLSLTGGSGSGDYGLSINGDWGVGINANDGDGVYMQGSPGNKSINAPQDIAVSDGNLTLAAIRDSVWSKVIETGYTAIQTLRLILSSTAAKLSGAATTTVVIRDINDTKNRITATVDSDGNRTNITTDVS